MGRQWELVAILPVDLTHIRAITKSKMCLRIEPPQWKTLWRTFN